MADEGTAADTGVLGFLQSLAERPTLLAEFRSDPQETLERSALTESQEELILGGDPQALREAIEAEGGPTPSAFLLILIIIVNK
jgi:hypothetical protein